MRFQNMEMRIMYWDIIFIILRPKSLKPDFHSLKSTGVTLPATAFHSGEPVTYPLTYWNTNRAIVHVIDHTCASPAMISQNMVEMYESAHPLHKRRMLWPLTWGQPRLVTKDEWRRSYLTAIILQPYCPEPDYMLCPAPEASRGQRRPGPSITTTAAHFVFCWCRQM